MIEAGLWHERKQRRKRIHQPRSRRDCVGELVQIDGCEHWWFEDRGTQCTLLVFIDDATGRLMTRPLLLIRARGRPGDRLLARAEPGRSGAHRGNPATPMVMFEMGRISQRLASPPPKVEVSQTKTNKPLGNSAATTPKSPEEHSVDPEFVEACLLDDDEWDDLPCPRPCFLPKLRKALQEPGDIAATHRVFRHLRSAARRQRCDQPS
jgi:hypothetical protein